MPLTVVIDEPIDPRLLQVNRRFKHSHALPKDVRLTIAKIGQLAADQYEAAWRDIPRDVRFSVVVVFTFPTLASDIDGPIKRTVDAVFRGIRSVVDLPHLNDARIVCLSAYKRVGTPHLYLALRTLDTPGRA